MGNYPSDERNGPLLDGSFDDDRSARITIAAESHRYLHYHLRPGIKIVYHEFWIIHQIRSNLFRQFLKDGCNVISDPPVQGKC